MPDAQIIRWPERGIARRATFPDGSSCEETAPNADGLVLRRVDPPFGYWQATAWAQERARLLGGTTEEMQLGPDGPADVVAQRRGPEGYGALPDGMVLTYFHMCYPGWAVWDGRRMSTSTLAGIEHPYAAALRAREKSVGL